MTNHESVEAGSNQSGGNRKPKREMTPAERVKLLQGKLYCKAKQERDYRFYVLYDKVLIPYVLQEAYNRVKANGGSPGIDGETFKSIKAGGEKKFLEDLSEDLRKQTYEPKAVKRVWIPKANGGKRPLGIPTIRDRVAQMACLLIIEPVFEADFEDSSYGFRPGRSAKDAIVAIKGHLQTGKTEVLDADLSAYFDTIPHDKLEKTLELRITDPRMLKLIRKWLRSPVYEDGQYHKGKKEGTPQGGVISPLLANIYMHLVDRIVNNSKHLFYKAGIKIVRYADDFVLMGRHISSTATNKLKEVFDKMGLRLNETKTHQIDASQQPFNFLGFTIRYDKDLKGRPLKYWNIKPSEKSEKKLREKIKEYLAAKGHYAAEYIADDLNAMIRGWLNYFDIPGVSYPAMSKRKLRYFLRERLNRYYNRKSQRRSRLYGKQAFELLVSKFGLIDPTQYFVKGRL
jgi:RNA-directed DNA polymerase